MVLLSDRPSCPEHPGSKVWLDGYYGAEGHKRKRYKCVLPNGARHVFTEKLPRLCYPEDQVCEECERSVPHMHGPTHPRHFHFQSRQIAKALVEVGQGKAYRDVAKTIRREANRSMTVMNWAGQPEPVKWGNMIHDWVEIFAPLIHEELFQITHWPKIVLIDELPYRRPARRSHGQAIPGGKPFFSILGAVGYTYSRKPFVLRFEAVPTPSRTNWMNFLSHFEGMPERIVCDQAMTITSAIWGRWAKPNTPFIHYCHWHLQRKIKQTIPRNRQVVGDPLWDTFQKAFWSPAEFDDFIAVAEKVPRMIAWIIKNAGVVRAQIEKKVHPYSTGPLEERLRVLGSHFKDRYPSFANRERLNRALMLMQLEMNGQRSETRYARIIRDHLEANDGIAPLRRQILDAKGTSSLRA